MIKIISLVSWRHQWVKGCRCWTCILIYIGHTDICPDHMSLTSGVFETAYHFLSTIYEICCFCNIIVHRTELQRHAIQCAIHSQMLQCQYVVLIRFGTLSPEKHMQNDFWLILIVMNVWVVGQCSKTLKKLGPKSQVCLDPAGILMIDSSLGRGYWTCILYKYSRFLWSSFWARWTISWV